LENTTELVPLSSAAPMDHNIISNFKLQPGEPITVTNTNTREHEVS